MRLKNLKSLVVAGCFVAGLVACESGPNVPAGEESKFLFALKTSETIGDQVGNVALDENGIMIHPGVTAPTSVSFALDGKLRAIGIKPYMAPLNEEGKAHADAGIVGVELLVDGKSVDKFTVDRNFSQEKTLDVKGAKSLEIRVDNGNGTPIWDWFHVKVTSVK